MERKCEFLWEKNKLKVKGISVYTRTLYDFSSYKFIYMKRELIKKQFMNSVIKVDSIEDKDRFSCDKPFIKLIIFSILSKI